MVPDPEVVDAFVTLSPGDAFVAFTGGISERRRGGTFFEDRVGSVILAGPHAEGAG